MRRKIKGIASGFDLHPDDRAVLKKYADTGHLGYLTGYYLSDFYFMPWQRHLHSAPQGDIILIGGVGSGKTVYKAASILIMALLNFNFGFMNLAPTSWQAALMFRAMKRLIADSPYEKFLAKDPVERPWPYILLKNGSLLEFRSASDLNLIMGWEGDQMCLDEAGVHRNMDELLVGMASRLRGKTSFRGKTRGRQGRLELMSMIYYGADWFYNQYDKAKDHSGYTEYYNNEIAPGQALHMITGEDAISMTVATASNVGLQAIDLERMRRRIPDHLQGEAMEGQRPEGAGEVFTDAMLRLCEDWSLNKVHEGNLREQEPGFDELALPRIGPVMWRMPYDSTRVYMAVGDPGPGDPPLRNSPVVLVWDITDVPKAPATLVSFRWPFGRGTYNPFLTAYFEEFNRYRPAICLADSTGPQKGFGSMVYQEWGLPVEPVDLSGAKKGAGISAATLLMSRGLLRFPYLSGLRSQLSGYILPDKLIAQDIVSCIIMTGLKLSAMFGLDGAADLTGRHDEDEGGIVPQRAQHARSPHRTRRSYTRRR